jgi:MOSC domain-containing protein YiiM
VRGRVISVNVGPVRTVELNGVRKRTGFLKEPVDGPVELGPTGFAGDGQAQRRFHGGPEMAAYLYSADDYAWWERTLGRALPPGSFGENLTVTGFRDGDVNIGDRIRIGPVLTEVTSPREPCATFAARMGEPGWVRRFLEAGRMGFYVRVLEPGPVTPGDGIHLEERHPGGLTVAEIHRLYARDRDDLEGLVRARDAADRLKDSWRAWLDERVEALSPRGG